MLTMDAFRADAFSAVSLTGAVDKMSFTPQLLGSIPGLFVDTPVRTPAVWIEARQSRRSLGLDAIGVTAHRRQPEANARRWPVSLLRTCDRAGGGRPYAAPLTGGCWPGRSRLMPSVFMIRRS